MKIPTFSLLLSFVATPFIHSIDSNLFECVTDYDASTDYFPEKVAPNDSQQWDIEYYNNYKILTNKIANDGQGETYLLYQCGTEPPSSEVESGKHAVVTSVPLQDGVALTSTVQITFLELLGLRTQIKSYIGDDQYISSSCMNQLISDGNLDVYENTTAASLVEWTDTHPSRIVFDGTYEGMPTSTAVQDQTVLISAHEEASNKAIFEWLEFYSAFFNAEGLASQIVNETAARYDCVASNADTLAEDDGTNPVAVWGYYSNYPGFEGWNVATCDPVVNYYCEYAKACDMELLTSDASMTHKEFSEFAKDADVFFYVSSDWEDVYKNNSAWLDDFKSVKNQQVYDYQLPGPNAWFEQRLAEYGTYISRVWVPFCHLSVVYSTYSLTGSFCTSLSGVFDRCCLGRLLHNSKQDD